jgi:hypothetical protein
MPDYALNDLIFIFLVGDTGTPTVAVTSGGTWNQLFQRVNTCSLTVFWKYAAASEVDLVLTASVNETYSGCAVTVRDVYQSYTGGSPPVRSDTTATGTRIALPTITTSADNSLVLAAISSSGTSSINFVEDALQDLVKADGAAEGIGVGWFFQKATGTTTAYNATSLASAAGAKVVIEVRAPAGGATIIPAYPTTDASILLTPSPGIAYDSNTALAATADTAFGTTIAGRTMNDGTVATAVNDIGIDRDAFMSFAGVTNTAVAGQMSGAETIMAAARYNVGTRNILGHFRHAAPSSNQRLSTVGSGRGVWFGMRSGTTNGSNFKVWQVHGADAPVPPGNTRPFIVNASNADQIATAGTLSNSDVRNYGFWTGGLGVLTQQATFGPMWAMDTITIAGGNAAEPITIPGIVGAAALYKVRYSSQLQGSNQMLCLQAVQFGNGGTNPTYLQVNGGAVEFPQRRSVSAKTVNYNGTDDSIGWTLYPGASDTINLAGTAFASANKYHWRIHASASASASYNFAGVAINGAGDVQLRAVTTFTGMSFTDCPTITQNAAVMQGCTFTDSKVISATPGDADNISSSVFVSSGTGHAIELSGTAADMTLTGNTFTGYASSNGSTGNEAIYVNIASGSMSITIADGGSTPSIRTAGATVTVIAGAVNVTVTVTDTDGAAISGAAVFLKAATGGPMPFDVTVTITNSGTTATVTHTAHGMATSDKVVISGASHNANNGVFTITVTNANTYTYTMGSSPGSNPTGTIKANYVVINGSTNGSGVVTMTRVFSSAQPFTGWARKSSSAPYYKQGSMSGTISSTTGASPGVALVSDD